MNKSSVHRRISNGKVVREKLGWFIVFVMIVALSFCYGNLSVSSAAVNMNNIDTSVQGIIGVWREDGSQESRTLKVNPDYTYELSDNGGNTSYGTIKVVVEEHPDGSYSPWYVFDDNAGKNWAGFSKDDEDGTLQTDLWSGQDGAMHFIRCYSKAYQDNSQEVAAKDYLGVWGCGRCSILIEQKNNAYIATITWASSAAEHRQWIYNCRYDKQNAILICPGNGICTDLIVYENGKEADINVYDDGSCELVMRNGILRWDDHKENAGQDMDFIQ